MKYTVLIIIALGICAAGLMPIPVIDGEQYPPVTYRTSQYGKFDVDACYQEIISVSRSKGWKCSMNGRDLVLIKNGLFGQWRLNVIEDNGYISPKELESRVSWFGRRLGIDESCGFVWHIIDKHSRILRK